MAKDNNCSFLGQSLLNAGKKRFGKNFPDLVNKYGLNIPAHEKDFSPFQFSTSKELFNSLFGKEFDGNTPYLRELSYRAIQRETDDAGTTYYYFDEKNNRQVISLVEANSKEKEGVYKVGKRVVPTDALLKKIIEINRNKEVYLSDEIAHQWAILKGLDKEVHYAEMVANATNAYLKQRGEKEKENLNTLAKELDAVRQELKELIKKAEQERAEKKMGHNVLHLKSAVQHFNNALEKYGGISKFKIKDSSMKNYLLLEHEDGRLVLVHTYFGKYYNYKTKEFIGQDIFENDIDKRKVDKYTNPSNAISLELYLTTLELQKKHGVMIHDAFSLSFKPFLDETLKLNLDIPSFASRINYELDYLLTRGNDTIYAQEILYQHKRILDHNKSTIANETSFMDKIDKLSSLINDEERKTLIGHINNNETKEAKEFLLKIANRNKYSLRKGELSQTLYELYEFINQLQENDVEAGRVEGIEDDINIIKTYLKDIDYVNNAFIQRIMDMVNQRLFNTKRKMLKIYAEANDIAKRIIEEHPETKAFSRVNIAFDSQVYFRNMVSADKRYIFIDPEQNTGLWAKSEENKRGWNKLTEAEKAFSRLFIKEIKQSYISVYGEAHYEENWEDGLIPIIKKGTGNQITEALKNQNKGALKEAISRALQFQTDFNQTLTDTTDLGVPNYYMYMSRSEHEEIYEETVKLYGGVELDLHKVLTQVTGNLIKKKEFSAIEGYYFLNKAMASNITKEDGVTQNKGVLDALHAIYQKYFLQENRKINTGNKKYNNHKTIRKILGDMNIDGVDIDNIISLMMKTNSLLSIALAPMNDLKNFTQGFLRALSRGIAGTISRAYGANAPFTAQELFDKYKFVFSAIADKEKKVFIEQMLKIANMYQSDLSDLTRPKYRATDTRFWLFRSNALYALNYLGDYANRAAVALAIVDKKIGLDAYTIKNGQIHYDVTKDKRYKSEEGKQILAYIDAEKNYGIDFRTQLSMKKISNTVFGSYDGETLRMIEMYSLGKMFMQFRKYLPDYLYESFASGKRVRALGDYKVKDGKVIWDTEYQEGVVKSLVATIANVPLLQKLLRYSTEQNIPDDVKQKRKENLAKFISDISFLIAIWLLFHLLSGDFDDDDEDKYGFFRNRINKKKFQGLAWDFVQTINPNTYKDLLTMPFVMARRIAQILGIATNLMKYEAAQIKGDDKKAQEYLDRVKSGIASNVPIVSSVHQTNRQMENILYEKDKDEPIQNNDDDEDE